MNMYVIVLIIAGIIGAAGLFLGTVTGIQKSFQNQPEIESSQTQKMWNRQQEIVQNAEYQRKRMMEDLKDKMRDNQY